MKKHTKIYIKHFGYGEQDFKCCEIPSCSKSAVDIHHILNRGMGGAEDKDRIENLMALCREHHVYYGEKKDLIAQLFIWHKRMLQITGKDFDVKWIQEQIYKHTTPE